MTKTQIKAELRRSACEDGYPYVSCNFSACLKLHEFYDTDEWVTDLNDYDQRTFFLLVAEAL